MLKKDKLDNIKLQDKTINKKEIIFFEKIADEWRNPNGKLKNIYNFNLIRCNYFHSEIINFFKLDNDNSTPLKGLNVLDIGCGAGLVAEALYNSGANVLGIDASENNIKVATLHAKKNNLNIHYRHCLTSDLIKEKKKFDIVLNTEVIEHVIEQEELIKQCTVCLKDNGLLIIATINKTFISYIKAIIGAEYILKLLPKGTHSWKYFIKPEKITAILNKKNLKVFNKKGMDYNIFTSQWSLTNNLNVNYIITAIKSIKN